MIRLVGAIAIATVSFLLVASAFFLAIGHAPLPMLGNMVLR